MSIILRVVLRFIILIVFQVLVLNNIRFGGYINPYLYVLFILMLPFRTPGWLLLIISFTTGYTVDILSNTSGMHAAASVLMAFSRPVFMKAALPKQEFTPDAFPSLKFMGFQSFFFYTLFLVLIHHTALFFIEVFRFSDLLKTGFRIVSSTAFTMIFIFISQYLFYSKQQEN